MMNKNIATVNHKEFHVAHEVIYPSISICFQSFGSGPFVDHQSMKKSEILYMMRGWTKYNQTFLGNSSYEDLTININDYVKSVYYRTTGRDYERYDCNATCFKASGGDSVMSCFSHDVKFERNSQIHSIRVEFDEKIRAIFRTHLIRVYFHHPGQLIRSGWHPAAKMSFTTNLRELKFSIQSLTVLRRRVDANIPCSSLSFDDDKNILENIGRELNCTSIYPGKIN